MQETHADDDDLSTGNEEMVTPIIYAYNYIYYVYTYYHDSISNPAFFHIWQIDVGREGAATHISSSKVLTVELIFLVN
jgi:hypothetical protein